MKNRNKLSSVLYAFNTNTTNSTKAPAASNSTSSNSSNSNTTTNATNTNSNNVLPPPDSPINSAIGLIATMANITHNQTSNGTNVFQGKNNASDAAGFVGNSNYSVTSPPYMVHDCNQIFLVDAERIISSADYSKREKGLFTLSIYMANVFHAKDVNKLVDSITLDRMNQAPQHLPGAPGCLDFTADGKNILVCVGSKDVADQLVKATFDFHNCRKGRKPITPDDIIRMLAECQAKLGQQNVGPSGPGPVGPTGQTPNANPTNNSTTSIMAVVNGATNSVLNTVNNPAQNAPKMQISPYYGSLKVPGT